MIQEKIVIVYFSGTGGTEYIARRFRDIFTAAGRQVLLRPLDLTIEDGGAPLEDPFPDTGLLLLLFPVYAFNAPKPVLEWIEKLPLLTDLAGAVISVSGGGNIWPNTLCRIPAVTLLEERGCAVFYENMLVMPSNFVVGTNEDLRRWLFRNLPEKMKGMAETILRGGVRRDRSRRGLRFIRRISRLESKYAKRFGETLEADDRCSGCGWCVRSCPRGNIRLEGGKPVFGPECVICLRCVYGCPAGTITSKKFSFIPLKEGYDLRKMADAAKEGELVPLEKCARGALWSGVRRYLREDPPDFRSE